MKTRLSDLFRGAKTPQILDSIRAAEALAPKLLAQHGAALVDVDDAYPAVEHFINALAPGEQKHLEAEAQRINQVLERAGAPGQADTCDLDADNLWPRAFNLARRGAYYLGLAVGFALATGTTGEKGGAR